MLVRPELRKSACPHDCPSACALEVPVLPDGRIGRITGARDNSYTPGVVCAKVARYAERIEHPDRLRSRCGARAPKARDSSSRSAGTRRSTRSRRSFTRVAQRSGSEASGRITPAATWASCSATAWIACATSCATRRQQTTICVTPAKSGWQAGVGKLIGADPREMEDADLIVVWGANPVSTQVNVMTHVARARKKRGTKLVVIDVYRTPTVEQADLALVAQARQRCGLGAGGDERAADGGNGRPRLPLQAHRFRRGDRAAHPVAHAAMGRRDHGPGGRATSSALPGSTAARGRASSAPASASPARATAPPPCTPSPACRP